MAAMTRPVAKPKPKPKLTPKRVTIRDGAAGARAVTVQMDGERRARHIGPRREPQARAPDPIQARFAALVRAWRAETMCMSSLIDIAMHPTYQQIIGMGPPALPLILRELGEQGGEWFWALRAITGEDPVPPDAQGDLQRMRNAWLEWARLRGHVA